MLQALINESAALLIGAITGGVLGAVALLVTWWLDRRARDVRDLLRRGLQIQALSEAWILEGRDYEQANVSTHPSLPEAAPCDGGLWLRRVEVRAVLDQAAWNAPEDNFYDIRSDGRRAWIVRDAVMGSDRRARYRPHPALMSSRAIEELCGWIEEVAATMRCNSRGRRVLAPLLGAVAGLDRRPIFRQLTEDAVRFLNECRDP
jgi:hypothetical protein